MSSSAVAFLAAPALLPGAVPGLRPRMRAPLSGYRNADHDAKRLSGEAFVTSAGVLLKYYYRELEIDEIT